MSVEWTPFPPELQRYVTDHSPPEDPFLEALRTAAGEANIPAISIGPVQASFLQIVLRAMGARRVAEVGTLAGYSSIVMARALPADGLVRTIELLPAHAAFAREWVAQSDVAGRVEVLEGDGLLTLSSFEDQWADAVFLDGDKGSYVSCLDVCARVVRPGGLVFIDNAFAFGELLSDRPTDREVPAVRRLNEHLPLDRRFEGIIVPVGDGMWMARRIGPS